MSTLYMVATPIGNLDDITYRAIKVLRDVDVIACEDTRHTRILLSRYQIEKRLIACHAHNEKASSEGIVALLAQGNDVAYVSDAGTPGISDPGAKVVDAVVAGGFDVVPIPGASALTTLVSISGQIGKPFVFEGFSSPRKGRRTTRLKELLQRNEAFILYESPFRIIKLLDDLKELDPSRTIVVGRELTKAFEEILRGTAIEIYNLLSGRPSIKGEFAVCVLPSYSDDDQETRESEE